MTTLADGLPALGAALMMAASPITGPCEGRTVQLCTGEGEIHHMLIWDEENPLSGNSTGTGVGKACHACTLDKRRDRRKRAKA